MVIEKTIRRTNHSLCIVVYVPGNSNSRSPIILVAGNALPDIQSILGGKYVTGSKSNSRKRVSESYRRNQIRKLDVITHTIVECHVGPDLPRVLDEEGKRSIL